MDRWDASKSLLGYVTTPREEPMLVGLKLTPAALWTSAIVPWVFVELARPILTDQPQAEAAGIVGLSPVAGKLVCGFSETGFHALVRP